MSGPRVVCLEACHCGIPAFDFQYDYTEYQNTTANEVLERIRSANIVITTIVPILPSVVEQCSDLRLIAVMATGCGWLDKEYFKGRGITVISCPRSNIPAVTEHAIGLYFACRRRTVEMHNRTLGSQEWKNLGTMTRRFPRPPLTCGEETLGIVGYGALGKRIEALANAVGFGTINIAERKNAVPRVGRISFEETLRTSTVLLICCPKDSSTINLIDTAELKVMRPDSILINMARGGIVSEGALAEALRQNWIEAAATDVLEVEPPDGSSPLLPTKGEPVPNLTISPHVSWYARNTIETLQTLLKDGVQAWIRGEPINVIV